MIPFREILPVRRLIPSKTPLTNWGVHKPDLKADFNRHCGYCYSYDGFKHTYYEVDHFVPKDFIKKNSGTIGLTQYNNLVYSCKFCNNKKNSNWPSNSETVFNDGRRGFVDPCNPEYDTHFYRTIDGGIMWRTDLGKWMFSEAFKFDERERSIKVLWNLYRLRRLIDLLVVELNKYGATTSEYNTIKPKLDEYSLEYCTYHKELIEYYE